MTNTVASFSPSAMLDAHASELERVRRWLRGAREAAAVIGLCGPAGVGKTTAALLLAREHAEGRPVLLVHAHGRDAASLAEEMARRSGGAPVVFVLDDVGESVRLIALAAPGTLILATGRVVLQAPTVDLRPWPEAAAVRLLAQRSGVHERDASLPVLCALVNRLPAAIEIVAAALVDARTVLPSDAAKQLAEERDRLLRRTLHVEEAIGIETALNYVYRRMGVAHQRVVRQLAVIDGAFDAAMAASVSTDADVMVDDLLRRRLLIAGDAGDGSDFRMPRIVRDYARARLSNSEGEAARMRYVENVVLRARVLKRRCDAGDLDGATAGFDALRRHVEAAFAAAQPDYHALPMRAARLLADLVEAVQDVMTQRMNAAAVRTWQRARVDALRRVRDVRGEIGARERLAQSLDAAGEVDGAAECRAEIERLQAEWAAERRSLDLLVR